MRTSIFLSFLFLIGATLAHAQESPDPTMDSYDGPKRGCGTNKVIQDMFDANPGLAEIHQKSFNRLQQMDLDGARAKGSDDIITIPVVFHVLYRNASQNVSESQLLSQLQVLNDDYRRTNGDAALTPAEFQPFAADARIEFCLATLDPFGFPTTGITRTETTVPGIGWTNSYYLTSQGGHDPWPPSRYMNIWVAEMTQGILGQATIPPASAASDGVVIDPRYIGSGGSSQFPYNKGRTGTHEVGHWLGLRHIWGDGNCGIDDGITDTPESDDANYGCTQSHFSCGTKDMVQNYMDYSNDACFNLFTQGQVDWMRNNIELYRSGLISSNACAPDNCEHTPTYPISGNTDDVVLSGQGGYLAGHNGSTTRGLAEHITNFTPYSKLAGVRLDFAKAFFSTASAKVVVKVWEGSTGSPGAEMFSQDLTINDIIANNLDIEIRFPNALDITSAFFAGIELEYTGNDTVALESNQDGESSPGTAWEKNDAGVWDSFSSRWGINFTMGIHPILSYARPEVIVSPATVSVAAGQSVTLTATGASSYTWSPSTGLDTDEGSVVVATPTVPTTYVVTGYSSVGCAGTRHVPFEVDGVLSTEEELNADYLMVYPNPSNGSFNVEYASPHSKLIQFEVRNVLGQSLWSRNLNKINNQYKTTVDLSAYPSGVYMLSAHDGNKQIVKKLILN